MKKILSYILTPIFFLFFGLTLGLFHIVQVIARNIFGPKAHDKSVAILNFCLMKCTAILGTRVRFKGFDNVPTNQALLIISNHQSMWDIPPVIWKMRKNRPKYIAKASLARFIPSISYNLKYGGSISIDRKDREGSIEKIKPFAQLVKDNNYSICIYPEGTRSRDGNVKPFKTAGIETILEVTPDILVAPIAIKNTGKIDNAGNFTKNLGITATFTLLPLRKINTAQINEDIEKVRQEIITAITD